MKDVLGRSFSKTDHVKESMRLGIDKKISWRISRVFFIEIKQLMFFSPQIEKAQTEVLNDLKQLSPSTSFVLGLSAAVAGIKTVLKFFPKRSYKFLLLKPAQRKRHKGIEYRGNSMRKRLKGG